MSVKTILVPFFSSPIDEAALNTAMQVAKQFDAHLRGLFLRPAPEVVAQFGRSRVDPNVFTRIIRSIQVQDAREEGSARSRFEEMIAAEEIAIQQAPSLQPGVSASWQSILGDPIDLIVRVGGAFDLTVVSPSGLGTQSIPIQIFDAAIFNTARPVLLAPADLPQHIGRSIIVAWNRGIQSGRALLSAAPFLEAAETVVIVTVTTEAKFGPEPEDVASNLAWHGISATVKRVPPDQRSVGQVLLDEVASIGADLLVMGAYSQSRLRDRVLGGVTRAIMAKACVPVLMAR